MRGLLARARPGRCLAAGRPWRTAVLLAIGLGLAAELDLPRASLAQAAPQVSMHASLQPKIGGHSTTIHMTIGIKAGAALVPPPLLTAQLRYPAGIDVQLSGLGIQACKLSSLQAFGPKGCPANSLMGYGRTVAEIPIKGEVIRETARIAVVRAAEMDGHLALMLVVYEEPAISAQIVLPAELLPAKRPFGGTLAIDVPFISTFPEGPAVSVSKIKLVLGSKYLKYRERVAGKLVHYKPAGIKLPERCSPGGFRFAVKLRFRDGSQATAGTSVRCPP